MNTQYTHQKEDDINLDLQYHHCSVLFAADLKARQGQPTHGLGMREGLAGVVLLKLVRHNSYDVHTLFTYP